MRATAILAVIATLAAIMPAAADGGHRGHGRGHQFGLAKQASFGAAVKSQQAGGTVNIVQNGNQNGVAVVAGGGTTNIAQNGNNNNLTVIQVNLAGRGAGKQLKRGRY